jgi:hypothetical protein
MTKVLNNFEYMKKIKGRMTVILTAVAFCLLVSYGILMEKTIANTVALTATQSALGRESGTESDLSEQYVALNKNISLDFAIAQGFTQASVTTFVNVPAAPAAVAANQTQTLTMNAGF